MPIWVYILTLFSDFCFAIQISNYKLALEGPVAYLDHCVSDSLSCKAIFQKFSYKKRVHQLNIYVIVCWRELNHIGPSLHIPLHINYRARSFHLVKLSHIFPANNVSPNSFPLPKFRNQWDNDALKLVLIFPPFCYCRFNIRTCQGLSCMLKL